MTSACRTIVAAVVMSLVAATASAQGWRGQGRMAGKVTDEQGKPVAGVLVKATLPGNGGTEAKTNDKGEWAIGGIAAGGWQLDFEKPGYEARHIAVQIQELTRIPPVEILMKRAADPNAEIKDQLTKAADLISQKKYPEARAVYESVLTKYPQAYQVEPYIARTYAAEGDQDKAIEHLRNALTKDPENVEWKLLLGSVLLQQGRTAEGRQVLASIDESKVTDPMIFLNVGIGLLNQNKAQDALFYFDKTVSRFPNYADGYYYRGLTEVQVGVGRRPDNAAEGDKQIQAGKADLEKFIQMAPTAPEAATAKKLLDQLK